MSQATVFKPNILGSSHMFYGSELTLRRVVADLIRVDAYRKVCVVETSLEGERAAEEMFDLSNNPEREEEKVQRWGDHPSLSVGDVVFVNDESWLCCPAGWIKL